MPSSPPESADTVLSQSVAPGGLMYPLGEIVFESNATDDNLLDLNSNPAYIEFVNSVQEAVFNGSRAAGAHRAYSRLYDHHFTDANGTKRIKKYKFYGQAINAEASIQESELEGRPPKDYNLVVFIVRDVYHSEQVFIEASSLFLSSKIPEIKVYSVGLAIFMLIALSIFTLLLIKFIVVDPIEQLTKQINSSEISEDNREKFITDILHRAEKKQRVLSKLYRNITDLEQRRQRCCNCFTRLRLRRLESVKN